MSEETHLETPALQTASILTEEEVAFIEARILSSFRDALMTREGSHLETRQHMVRLNIENWITNSVAQINTGRAELQSRGFVGVEPILVGSPRIIGDLDTRVANTHFSYRDVLLQNDLISGTYVREYEEDFAILIVDCEINDVLPMINQDFFLNWREASTSTSIKKPRFSEEVVDTAWNLLKEYMTEQQYFAFMEGTKIEIQSNDGEYRLLLDKNGDFMVLKEEKGSGIVSSTGRIKSYDYPLGDEIAAFLDWFRFKTEELISQWNCGTYGIVKEGQRR